MSSVAPSPRPVFRTVFVGALAVLLAALLGSAVVSLRSALLLIFLAFFICLGLTPVIRWLERRRLSRGQAVLVVLTGFLIVIGVLGTLIIPSVVRQITELIQFLPDGIGRIEDQAWFTDLDRAAGGILTPALIQIGVAAQNPAVWATIGGGALQVSTGLVNAVASTVFVIVLTLYFVTSLESIKSAAYSLVPASRRAGFTDIAETIIESVGKYLSGMVLLAAMNASFTFIVLIIAGVRFAPILTAIAFLITLIPLVGSIISTVFVTTVALFTSPTTGLVVLIVMLVYVQIEAYVLTPRIVGKAINIPGSLVLIGALIGGTLLGLLGALIACPTSASIVLILKKITIPAQERR